jgi:hypothetical protein
MQVIHGITGTHRGYTPAQRAALSSIVRHPSTEVIHHGDCVGVDALAHDVAFEAHKRIAIHPPSDGKLRAFKGIGVTPKFIGQIVWYEPKPYLDRDDDIVDVCTTLIAVPFGPESMRGSGTWYTIRRARDAEKPRTIIWPDGSITHD